MKDKFLTFYILKELNKYQAEMLTSQAVTRTGMRNIYDGYEELFRERERESY